ncbi:SDR family oxidoreductase [Actinokineospora sp. HUAS TT18]|uniref:SDR family oxidoreductase n=1 Tax=Actinokineospora sp. HUAS TT18 TaxID=3447451 RepID=UPI003F52198A
MSASIERPGVVIGVTLPGAADARLCAAVTGAGGLGVLDLGRGDRAARAALAQVTGRFGVRVPPGCALGVDDVLDVVGERVDQLGVIVLGWQSAWQPADIPGEYFVLVEVASAVEAQAAVDLGADGLVLRGAEAGGRVSDLGAFVLLQQVLADPLVTVPVWVCGGIGPNTAAGAVLAGAAGVVLDTQLALLPEADIPAGIRSALVAGDGSAQLDGYPIAGQDAFLAQTFVQRHGSVTRAVRAVLGAVDAALAPGAPAMGEGATLARGLGTTLPIAQGPMTRVSDQPAFADAVARHGALPFLALALSTEEQTRALLTETKAALGDRPWGVGVLGFAPEDLRTAQLDVIKEIRPATALIAGGRPDQARVLEDVGIATFLHVPSPGLLSQFLAAGARRFVFEGSECGGHVGPMTSFSLWSAQVGVLLDAVEAGLPADELQLLFAGGIHDARSAAAVAGVADALARRGAGVGVLMGTGYLFTAEAVSCGAVRPTFQRQVIAATRTELLQTAPGHATRCVSSPFTGTFHAVGAELLAQGVPEREVWERLELLNTGRLRIASKGVRREGDELLSVCEDEQLDQGLFMAGDVALLRSAATTIAALHHEVTRGAAALRSARVAELRSEADPEPVAAPLDVAIVGMSAMFPGADGLAAFWSTVVSGTDAVTEVPAGRWDVETYFDPDSGPDRTPSKWGGFLPEIPFDPLSYGIPPATLSAIEPVQLLALEAARRALVDAGYPDGGPDRERTSVVFGAEAGSDLATATTLRMALPEYVGALPEHLAEQLPALSEDTFPGRLANVIAGRIANRLDLGGANYTVDAACASSLAAVDIACKELVAGTSDVVLCGGADLHNAVDDYLLFSSVGALSATGRCRTFDASADGIALGEGVACVVLKRLADAERDGDRVYAVIRGVGSGSDGKALGLTAPRPEGQRRAIERAYRSARVSPKDIGLVEAHGTGTVVGDRTELQTLDAVFTDAGAAPGTCVLGSVKSQIGHTKCAAGLAGLIKAALAVHTGVKPPTLHVTQPNPAWNPDSSPFVFHAAAVPWTAPPLRRIAGVSAFGFGGTNFHVVLRGHPQADLVRHGRHEWPAELLTFRGTDLSAARRQAERLLTLATTNTAHGSPWTLRDLARTASERADRDPAPIRIAFVARDLAELETRLRAAVDGGTGVYLADEQPSGKLAMLFPGQGSQRPGMLAELFVAFPDLGRLARQVEADTSVIFPPSAFGAESAHADRLRDTRAAQPALGLAGLAVHHVLDRLGVTPDLLAGHSYGELVALTAAGAMDAATLLRLSAARAEAILDAAGDDPGTMAAVSAGRAATAAVLDAAGLTGTVVVANDNAPQQVVISGATPAVDQALAALRDAGLSAQRIPVACAFHSPVVAHAGELFADALADERIGAPELPVWSNRTASVYGGDVRAELSAQIGSPVRFAEQIEAMYADGARVFVEAGPGRVLSGLVGRILGDRPHTVITCDGDGLVGLLDAVARLAVTGIELRTGWLFAGRDARDVTGMTPPKRPGWTVDGAFVRTVDGAFVGLAPARKITLGTVATNRDEVITDFLRTSRELIAAQRDVVLGYLGAAPVSVAEPARPVVIAPAVVEPVVSDALTTVVEVIAARTGYPVDMIDPALDLEADLSVDSIKRTEIAGEVAARFGSGSVDALVKARTAAAMAEALGGKPKPAASEPLTVVIEVIAARTGYPVDMIDPALDLEADLSVDSIKRTEIAGEIAARFGSGSVDALVKARTAAAMAQALGGEPATPAPALVEAEIVGSPAQRFVLDLVASDARPMEEITAFVGTHILIAGGDPELADELADQLSARGAMAFTFQGKPELDPEVDRVDGLISLHALSDDEPVLPGAFPLLKSVLARRPRWLLAVGQAPGLRGLFRSLDREYPDVLARVVEIAPDLPPVDIAAAVVEEMQTAAEEPVVVRDAARRIVRMVPERLGALATAGAGPGGIGAAEAAAIGLDRESVVLLVGGARGITAQVAVGLARAAGCRIELAGRTVLAAAPEHSAVAAATDLAGVRAALAGLGGRDIAAVERDAREILAQREVAATLREIREAGGSAEYHSVDVRDGAAVRQLVKQVHAEHGRLDGVVYAAGVIEDRLVADKDPASFDRVYGTKVDGALALLDVLTELAIEPRFVVCFGSIAAALGNRGQADYAAANDAMAQHAADWSDRTGCRALTVHWGPWAPIGTHGGMVSAELGRAYAQRGVALLDPADGVACLLRELAWGDPARRAVVYTASEW